MPNPSGVFVLGMHRSGTSAVTRALNLLGLPLGDPERFLPASAENPKGFWENADLTSLNEEILEALGGSWSGPPRLGEGWAFDARLDPLRERGHALFESVYGDGLWAWKDPRNCLLLPFWQNVLNASPVVILVHRNPVEIAHSLAARNGFSKWLSLALWERYMREAMRACSRLPVLVTAYGDLLDDADGWCAAVRPLLQRGGIVCDGGEEPQALSHFLDRKLRHSTLADAETLDDPDLSDAQRRLLRTLADLRGAHESFRAPDLGAETPWTEPLLAERRRVNVVERRRVQEFQAFDREIARLRQGLEDQEQRRAAEMAAELDRREDERSTQVRALEREIEHERHRLELLETENDSLSAEILRLGKLTAAQSERRREAEETIPRLHGEIAVREELLRAMRQTRIWRMRSAARRLLGRGA